MKPGIRNVVLYLSGLGLALLLAGCGDTATPTALTQSGVSGLSATTVLATATATLAPTATSAPTTTALAQTATSIPTSTPEPSPTSTPAPTATTAPPAPPATATPAATATLPATTTPAASPARTAPVASTTAAASSTLSVDTALPTIAVSRPATPAATAAPDLTALAADQPDTQEQLLLSLLNDFRKANSRSALTWDRQLFRSARWMARDASITNSFLHIDSLGRSPTQRAKEFGFARSFVGENIAGGLEPAGDILKIWQSDDEHKNNLLSAGYNFAGIGRYYNPASLNQWYWVLVLG